jgi:hypothetical protein
MIDAVDLPSYREVMEMCVDAIASGSVANYDVPALWTTGWYDYPGGAELFTEMRTGAATPTRARAHGSCSGPGHTRTRKTSSARGPPGPPARRRDR